MPDYAQISLALQGGKHLDCERLVQAAVAELRAAGRSDAEIGRGLLEEGLMAGMSVVGEKFKLGVLYVPQVLLAARAMNTASAVLKPLLAGGGVQPRGRVVLGTVKGDLHDIGKNLVRMMLEGGGFQVIDVGIDVPNERFVEAARKEQPQIVGLSALLTTTMPRMSEVIQALRAAGVSCKVLVGGAPVTQGFADQIGADGYAPDAASAVDVARRLSN